MQIKKEQLIPTAEKGEQDFMCRQEQKQASSPMTHRSPVPLSNLNNLASSRSEWRESLKFSTIFTPGWMQRLDLCTKYFRKHWCKYSTIPR